MNKNSVISAVAVAATGTLLFTILLTLSQINEATYLGLMCMLSLVSLVVLALPRVQELNLKEMKLTLSRIEDAQKDVYAKHSQMAEAAKLLAELIVYNMSWQGRAHAGRKPFEDFNKSRIQRLLSSLGLPEHEIRSICDLDAFDLNRKQDGKTGGG